MRRLSFLRLVPLLLTLLVAIALISGCAARTPGPQVVFALLDLSGSTGGVREEYLRQVERIIQSVPVGARLVILPVSSRSLTEPSLFDQTFPSSVWWQTNTFKHGRAVSQLRKQAGAAVAAAMGKSPDGRGTALVDSLFQVQEFLKPYPDGSAMVYIISDMVEQSELLDLYNLTDEAVAPALATVEKARRLPDLKGAGINISGLEPSGHLPAGRIMAIKSFWEEFFSSAGARLLWYSPTLQLPDQLR